MTPEQIRAWVDRSCTAQQVPVTVTDPATLARIGALLGRDGCAAAEGRAAPAPGLQPPDRTDAVGIEPVPAPLAWPDHGMVKHSSDDGTLPVQVERGPLAS